MTDWNHVAYDNVLDCLEPQFENEEYLERYRFWRSLQKFPGDEFDNDFEY